LFFGFFKETLCEVIKTTVIKWGRATHINDPNLIREMFKLIYNQYDGIGEVKKKFSEMKCRSDRVAIGTGSISDLV
jgi:hypothetical protein